MVVSQLLLEEMTRALAYPKLRKLIDSEDAHRFIDWLSNSCTKAEDSDEMPPIRSSDLGDDYLLALAYHEDAALVSGDRHLLDLAEHSDDQSDELPIFSPVAFLKLLEHAE